MLTLKKTLIFGLLSLAVCSQVAFGTEIVTKVSFSPLLPAPAVIEPDVPQPVVLEMKVLQPAVVSDIKLTGKGWIVSPITRTLVETIDSVEVYRIEFEVSTADDSQPIELSYSLDGDRVVKAMDISADKRLGRDSSEVAVHRASIDAPHYYPSEVSLPDFEPEPFNLAVVADPHETGPAPDGQKLVANKSVRNISISGELQYKLGSQYRDAYGTTVFALVRTWGQDRILGTASVQLDGTFNLEVLWHWDPVLPDIYLIFKPSRGGVTVMQDDYYLWDPNEYFVHSQTFYEVEGTSLDTGWHGIEGSSRGAFHILNSLTKSMLFLFRYGGYHAIPRVEVLWPSDDGQSAYNYFWEEIRIGVNKTFSVGTHIHEYGHFVVHKFGYRPGDPQYCNGLCNDDPPCPHNSWCRENSQVAWSEGFPNWFCNSVCRDWTERYEFPPKDPYDHETVEACPACDETWYHDPWITEGFFAAMLNDLEDSGFEENPDYRPQYNDLLDLDPSDILDVFVAKKPTSTHGWITHFTEYMWDNYPNKMPEYWETCAFNGYTGMDDTPPSTPMLYSPTHTVGEWSNNNNLQVNRGPAADDFSGIGGYCYSASTNIEDTPGYVINTGLDDRLALSMTVEDLSPGFWYFTLRAVDRDGNWDPGYKRFGPVQIVPKTPGDLKPERKTPNWAYPLVPKSTRVTNNTDVPSDGSPLYGNHYWNASVVNQGEQTTPGTHATIFIDGQMTEEVFLLKSLEAGEYDTAINQGLTHLDGGRHTYEIFADNHGEVAELIETNNRWGHQWIWIPDLLTENTVYTLPGPPLATGGQGSVTGQLFWFNCHGLRVITAGGMAPSPWAVVATHAVNNHDDVDLQLHDDPTTAWTGFDHTTFLANSQRSHGLLDAVLVNAGNRGRAFYSVGVYETNPSGPGGDYRAQLEYGHELNRGIPYVGLLGNDRGIDLFTVGIFAEGPMQLFLQKYNAMPSPPIYVAWYNEDFIYGGLLDYDAVAVTGDEGWVRLDVDVDPGTHGILLWRDPADAAFGEVAYTLRVQPPPPDLVAYQPAGWASPLVPTVEPVFEPGTTIPEPDFLIGDRDSTCLNLAFENSSPSFTNPVHVGTYVDGVQVQETLLDPIGGWEKTHILPVDDITVPGGRHLVAMKLDNRDFMNEEDEWNNTWGTQYVWTPSISLNRESVLRFDQPPDPTADWDRVNTDEFLYFNCSGIMISKINPLAGKWAAVGILPGAHSDLDLKLFLPHTTPRDGFDFPLVESSWAMGESEFVLVYQREAPTRYFEAGVYLTQATEVEDYAVTLTQNITGGTDPDGVVGTYSFSASQFLGLYEFDFTTPGAYTATLDIAEPTLDLGFSLYRAGLPYYAKDDVHQLNSAAWTNPAGVSESFPFTVGSGEEGYYCLAVWKVDGSNDQIAGSYTITLELEPTLAELEPYAPSGWEATVVPRPFQDATHTFAPIPAAIPGDTVTTYLNYSFISDSEAADPGFCEIDVTLDGAWVEGLDFMGGTAGTYWFWLDPTPQSIPGGRHTLGFMVDRGNQLPEIDETNNTDGAQYVWTPKTLQLDVPDSRTQLWRYYEGWEHVPAGTLLWPNADGVRTPVFQPQVTGGYYGCVAVLAQDAADVDLDLHLPSTGFTDGFTTPLVSSVWAPGHLDFVVINFNKNSGRQFDAGIVSGSDAEEQIGIVVTESNYMGNNPNGMIGSYLLEPDELVDLFEFFIDSLGSYRVILEQYQTTCDLGVSLYGPDGQYYAKGDALDDGLNGPAISFTAAPGETEAFDVIIDTPGFYVLGVWKGRSPCFGSLTNYSLEVTLDIPSGVDDEEMPPIATRLVGAYPNPFNPMTTVAFELATDSKVRVEVFDLRGHLIRTLVDESLPAGRHERVWQGEDRRGRIVSSGSYVIRLKAGTTVDLKRVSLLK